MTPAGRQRGISFIGFLFMAGLVAFFALVGMKLLPLYNEAFKVTNSMKSVAGMSNIADQSAADIRKLILRNFEVQDVDEFSERNIREHLTVTPVADGTREMTFTYESRTPLFGNLDVVMNYEKTISIPGSGGDSN